MMLARIDSVVVLNDFCHAQGGASRVAIDEAIALRRLGVEVYFLGAVGPVCPELEDADVRVVCLDQPELANAVRHPISALRAMWNQVAYQMTRTLLAPLDPGRTIVHLHGYTKALSTAPALAARRAGFRVICTLHDFFAACPNGAFYDYRRQAPCPLRALSRECIATACDKRHASHKAYRVLRASVQRTIAKFPSCVAHYITLSRRSGELLRPYLPPDARLYPLANIIDVERAPPVDPGSNTDLKVVGRLDEEKGVMLAARAAAAVRMPIVFVGDGPLRARVEATGARVTGWLAAPDVHCELDAARCLVFPSLWYETFGLVVSEAAARGVPAIVSDISAPADRITNGSSGWIFRSGDLDDLVARMQIARTDSAVRAAGQAAWREYWESPADPASHARDLMSIYAAVVACDSAAVSENSACEESISNNADASSNPRQSMNVVSLAKARARVSSCSGPNHPTASA